MPTSKLEQLLDRVYKAPVPELSDLEHLLSLTDEKEIEELHAAADWVRREYAGDGILLRGIVEFSSYCKNTCHYCGLNKQNNSLSRFRMTKDEILESTGHIASCGIRTVVLQSGEDDDFSPSLIAEIVRDIKTNFGMAVTLSVGEQSREEYKLWKQAGADRYLLKIETTDEALYSALHPGMSLRNRVRCLEDLKSLGYEVGSGIIVGLKGQTIRSIARDILFFKQQEFDMIGIGPFIPHPKTQLGAEARGDAAMTLKVLAVTRLVTRNAHLPATTALGSMGKDFRIDGLKAGANVLMPNFTPQPYKKLYEIYPGKRCNTEAAGLCSSCMEDMVRSLHRTIDYSTGGSLKHHGGFTNA